MPDRDQPENTVVPFERRPVAPIDPNNLLRIERLLREHGRSVAKTYLPSLRAIDRHVKPEMRAYIVTAHREALEHMLEGAATSQTLEMISDALDIALNAYPDEGAVEFSLAALIDSRMRLPHNLPIFVEAAIFDLVDLAFPPCVVAAACEKIRRERTYFPEISEIIAVCRETQTRYREQQERVRKAIADRREAELWLQELKNPAKAPLPVVRPPRSTALDWDPDA